MKSKYPDIKVREILYSIYEGTCQYCYKKKDINKMITEHIVSRLGDRSDLLYHYRNLLKVYPLNDWGLYPIGEFWIYIFPIINLKTPRDYCENYLLSCRRCNAIKSHIGDRLNPEELIFKLKIAFTNSDFLIKSIV